MRSAFRLLLVALLLTLSAALARAQVLSGIDAMSSTVLQEHQSSFSGLGLRVRLHSASIVEGFELLPYVEYWRNSSTVERFNITTVRKDATLGAQVRYSFHREGWYPYVGGGVGLHFLSSEVDAPTLGLPHATSSLVKGGLSGLLGVTFPMTAHVDNFLEAEYHNLPGFSQLKLNWGLSWGL